MEPILTFPTHKRRPTIERDYYGYVVRAKGKKPRLFLTFREALCYCYGKGYIWEHGQIDVLADYYREKRGIV